MVTLNLCVLNVIYSVHKLIKRFHLGKGGGSVRYSLWNQRGGGGEGSPPPPPPHTHTHTHYQSNLPGNNNKTSSSSSLPLAHTGEQIQQFLLKLLTETSHSDSEETAGESTGAAVNREARVRGFSTEDGSSSTAPVGIMASDKQCRTHVHNEDTISPQPCNSSNTNEFHQSQNREVSNTDTTGRPASLHAWIQKLLDYTSTQ